MSGKNDDNNLKGIIPRVAEDVFEFIRDNENLEFIVQVSIVDIYKDKIKDLITNNDININLDEEPSNNKINFEGIYEKSIINENEVLKILEKGINNKSKLDYNINLNGNFSKSNFIFILKLIQNNKKEELFTKSELIFMDTSGEENLFSFEAPLPNEQASLSTFFKKIFYGNYKTSLIITCSPSIFNQEITLQFLRFGEKMKKIKNNAEKNEEVSYNKLKKQLLDAKEEIQNLKNLMNKENNKKNDIIKNNKDLSFDEIFKSILDNINKENKEKLDEQLYNLKDKYNSDIDNLNKKIDDLEQKIKFNNDIKNKLQKNIIIQQTKNLEFNNIINDFIQFISELKKSKEINTKLISNVETKLKNMEINNINKDINIQNKNDYNYFHDLTLVKNIELNYINDNNMNNIIINNSQEIKSEKYAQTIVNQSRIEKIELEYENDIKYLRLCLEENKDIILELKNEIINLQNKNKILENNSALNERKIRDKNLLLENSVLELKKKYEESQTKRLILESKCRKLNKIFTDKRFNLINAKDESINKSIATPKNIIKILPEIEEDKI
jgi:kinesin family protein 5